MRELPAFLKQAQDDLLECIGKCYPHDDLEAELIKKLITSLRDQYEQLNNAKEITTTDIKPILARIRVITDQEPFHTTLQAIADRLMTHFNELKKKRLADFDLPQLQAYPIETDDSFLEQAKKQLLNAMHAEVSSFDIRKNGMIASRKKVIESAISEIALLDVEIDVLKNTFFDNKEERNGVYLSIAKQFDDQMRRLYFLNKEAGTLEILKAIQKDFQEKTLEFVILLKSTSEHKQ